MGLNLAEHKVAEILVSLSDSVINEQLAHPLSFSIIESVHRRLSEVHHCSLLFKDSSYYHVVVKILKKDGHLYTSNRQLEKRILSEFHNLTASGENFPIKNIFKIPVALCVVPNKHALIVEYAGGEPVETHFKDNFLNYLRNDEFISKVKHDMAICGEFMGRYHSANYLNNTTLVDYDLVDDLVQYIVGKIDVVERLMARFSFNKKFCNQLRGDIYNIAAEFDCCRAVSNTIVRCHGDFTPANILISEEEVFLIDFADAKCASKYLDVACFLTYLEMLHLNKPLLYPVHQINSLQKEFMDHYMQLHPQDGSIFLWLFRLRYLLTNLIMQLYDSEKSFLHMLYYRRRICRYHDAISNLMKMYIAS